MLPFWTKSTPVPVQNSNAKWHSSCLSGTQTADAASWGCPSSSELLMAGTGPWCFCHRRLGRWSPGHSGGGGKGPLTEQLIWMLFWGTRMKAPGFPQPDREPEPSREVGSCNVTLPNSLNFSFVKWVEKKKNSICFKIPPVQGHRKEE